MNSPSPEAKVKRVTSDAIQRLKNDLVNTFQTWLRYDVTAKIVDGKFVAGFAATAMSCSALLRIAAGQPARALSR
jgi:hypothetical protein